MAHRNCGLSTAILNEQRPDVKYRWLLVTSTGRDRLAINDRKTVVFPQVPSLFRKNWVVKRVPEGEGGCGRLLLPGPSARS